MGERKVLNKYFPPDFDPLLIPKNKRPKGMQVTVRIMLPMSIQCNTCGEYIYRGKKFNARKEEVLNETYLGLKIWRFYFRCTACCAEITFKTDPKNSDYAAENGASRNFEPWRDQQEINDEMKALKEEEEKGDVMKKLENRTQESKREMDILDALEEIKEQNARHRRVDTDLLLDTLHSQDNITVTKKLQEEEDEREMRRAFGKQVDDEQDNDHDKEKEKEKETETDKDKDKDGADEIHSGSHDDNSKKSQIENGNKANQMTKKIIRRIDESESDKRDNDDNDSNKILDSVLNGLEKNENQWKNGEGSILKRKIDEENRKKSEEEKTQDRKNVPLIKVIRKKDKKIKIKITVKRKKRK